MSSVNGSGEGHGASVKRVEDPPFLRGLARTPTTCATPTRCTRCSCARASPTRRSAAIDTSEAAAMPGVVGVYTAADLNLEPFPTAGPPVDTPEAMRRPVLATDVVRFIGEPIAVVVAETRAPGGGREPVRRRRLRGPAGARRHDQGARRRRADPVPGRAERQPRRGRPDRRGRARRRRGARRRAVRQPADRRRADGAGRRAGRARPGDGRLHPVDAEPGPARLPGHDLQVDRDREGASCASSRPRPAAASARASRATRSRSWSSRSPASSAAPCATSRRARRRCSRCSTAARRCRTSRSAARATARSPG